MLEQAAPGWFWMIRVPVFSLFSEKTETMTIKKDSRCFLKTYRVLDTVSIWGGVGPLIGSFLEEGMKAAIQPRVPAQVG